MRKTLLFPAVLGSLLVVGIGLATAVRQIHRSNSAANQQAGPNQLGVSVFTVLHAHSSHDHKAWLRFSQTGTLMYYTDTSAESQPLFERRLSLSTDGSLVRYDKATLNRNQSYLFDGNTLVRTTIEAETQLEATVVEGVEAASVKFQVATFGILPILKRLSEQSTQVTFVGATSKGDRFQV